MATDAVDIDWVIREVLRRLQQSDTPRAAEGELILTARVISTDQLEGRLAGIKHVRVPNRAVITPAVRDLLKQHDIALQEEATASATRKENTHLVVGRAASDYESGGLIKALGESGIQVEQIARTGLVDGMDEVSSAVRLGGSLGLMLTSEVHTAVCLANRHRGVRAARVSTVKETTEAVASLGANLLVIDPTGTGTFELRKMIELFCENPHRACCESLQSTLG